MKGYALLLSAFSVGIGGAALALGGRFRPRLGDLMLAGFAASTFTVVALSNGLQHLRAVLHNAAELQDNALEPAPARAPAAS